MATTASNSLLKSYSLTGELYLSKSGWLLLHVPNDVGRGAFRALNEHGIELPTWEGGNYDAHISVMSPEDVQQAGGANNISERGKEFSYSLGHLREFTPSGWPEMEKCWAIEVHSPDLERLRKSYGLSALPRDGKHKYHITVAVRRRGVLGANDIAKATPAAETTPRDSTPTFKLHDKPGIFLLKASGDSCPACGGTLTDVRGKLVCEQCRRICEGCCEGSLLRQVNKSVYKTLDKKGWLKEASFSDAMYSLAEPAVRHWVNSKGYDLGEFNPKHNWNDVMETQRFNDTKNEAIRMAARQDSSPLKVLHGFNALLGKKWNISPAHDKSLQDGFASVAPHLMRWSPEFWDSLHGGTGSIASLTAAIADSHRYQGITSEQAANTAKGVFDAMYADPMLHRGFGAQDLGSIYREAAKRGLIGRGQDAHKIVESLGPVVGVASAIRDTTANSGAPLSAVPDIFGEYDKVRAQYKGHRSSDIEGYIRTNQELRRQGGPMAAALAQSGVPMGTNSLDSLSARNSQLMDKARDSSVGRMVAATARLKDDGVLKPNSPGEQFLERARSGELNDNDIKQWHNTIGQSTDLPPGAAQQYLVGNSHDTQRYLTPDLLVGIRASQGAIDMGPHLNRIEHSYTDAQDPHHIIRNSQREQFVGQVGGYDGMEEYEALQGAPVKQLPGIMAKAQTQGNANRAASGYGMRSPVRRVADAVKEPEPTIGGVGKALINATPMPPTAVAANEPPSPIETPKMAAADAQHILVSGYSGSGKSTLAQQLGKQHNMPVTHLDEQFEDFWPKLRAKWRAMEKDPEDPKNPLTLSKMDEDDRTDLRNKLMELLSSRQPRVIEGTQLSYLPDAWGTHRRIVVDTPDSSVVRQRMQRDRLKIKDGEPKYPNMYPGSPMARKRALTAKSLIADMRPALDQFRVGAELMRPTRPAVLGGTQSGGISLNLEKAADAPPVYYHGSPKHYDVLNPSNMHGDPGIPNAIFATSSRPMALAYSQKWSDLDLNQGSYGSRTDPSKSVMYMSEMYPGALQAIYGNRRGYLYDLPTEGFHDRPDEIGSKWEQINEQPVTPLQRKRINNPLKAMEEAGVRLLPYDPKGKEFRMAINSSVARLKTMSPEDRASYIKWRLSKATPEVLAAFARKGVKPAEKQAVGPGYRGIPDRKDMGDLSKLAPKDIIDLIIQRHDAVRAGTHRDLRIGDRERGLYSWAMRAEGLPEKGQKVLANQQPVHLHQYGDFQGTLGPGYGQGTVRRERKSKILITQASPTKIEFTTADTSTPERFVLFKPAPSQNPNKKGFGDRQWLLMNNTPTEGPQSEKPHMKSIPAEEVEPFIDSMQTGTTYQAKLDGARSLVKLMKGGVEVLSYRTSKRTGGPITHTEKMFGGRHKVDYPKELEGSTLVGELTARDKDDKTMPPQTTGGVLNSTIENSLKAQQTGGMRLHSTLFDAQSMGKKPVDYATTPYADRRKMIEQIMPYLPQDRFGISPQVEGPAAGKQLWQQVISGQHPHTTEGIVAYPPAGPPIKAKQTEDADIHITGVFPGEGKYQGQGIGGFNYALEPGGKPVGKVGTGLSDELRTHAFAHPEEYIGRIARIQAQQQLPSGAYRAPAFLALHEG